MNWAKDARNALDYLEGRDFEGILAGARWGLPAATIWLLYLVLPADLGFSEGVQLEAARNVYGALAA